MYFINEKKYLLLENDFVFLDNVYFFICLYSNDILYCYNLKLYLWLFLFLKYGLKILYVRGFCVFEGECNWWIYSLGIMILMFFYNDENRIDFVY